jgi:large repetitive protein
MLVALLGVLGASAGFALASSGPPTPTITSAPDNPTASTFASFSFRDAQKGVTFVCSIDGSPFRACSSPKSYSGLVAGAHTFSVEARSGSTTSSAASYSWTIDLTPPSTVITFPVGGSSYNAGGWGAGCQIGTGVCGTAADQSGVALIAVSIRQNATGFYWNGRTYRNTSEAYFPANLYAQSPTGAKWFYPLPLPTPDGAYTVHVLAIDWAGNYTPLRSPATSIFTIATASPPAPSITSKPNNPTTSTTATFAFTDSQPGAKFQCRLDGGSFTACSSPTAYSALSVGTHTFSVRALDAAGNISSPSSYSWTIQQTGGLPFAISGNAPGSLYPGAPAHSVPLTLTNPNSVTIYVTALAVSMQSTGASGCNASWFQITQASIPSAGIAVPANGAVTLPVQGATAPALRMLDSGSNQDACQGAALTLTYTGSAHS